MIWIVEDLGRNNDVPGLKEAIKNKGIQLIEIGVGQKAQSDFTKDIPKHSKVVFNGSIETGYHLRRELDHCFPVIWYTKENYFCSHYYHNFHDLLFNDEFCFTTAKAFEDKTWFYYQHFSKQAVLFIRPDSGEKSFTGQLLDYQDVKKMWGAFKTYGLQDQDLVVVSTPKNIKAEWRFICSSDGDIIAQSLYVIDGQRTLVPSAPSGARECCEAVLAKGYFPDRFFTVDICLGMDDKYYLLELNSFNSAGLYAADKVAIVERIWKEFK